MTTGGISTKRRSNAEGTPAGDSLTPAMRQYVEQKKRVGDAVLLFRMGDFYETFWDDAKLCARVLGIALTSRSKKDDEPIPLAGIPYHALDNYLRKLVAAGYRVAISEQLEDPKQAKGVVRRDVVRIVTAGTLTEDTLLDEREDNVLASVAFQGKQVGLAFVELAGGRFEVVMTTPDAVLDDLVRQKPAEFLIDDDRGSEAERLGEQLRQIAGTALTRRLTHEFSAYQAEQSLLKHFDVSTLAGFGFEKMDASLCAAGSIVQYLQETQKTALGHIASVRRRVSSEFLQVDHSSWRSLEIERTLRSGSREGTLLHAIDRTVHPIGGRKLAHWLRAPSTDRDTIVHRQDAVTFLVDNDMARSAVREKLKSMADIERIAARVALGRASPRDLRGLGDALRAAPHLAEMLGNRRARDRDLPADSISEPRPSGSGRPSHDPPATERILTGVGRNNGGTTGDQLSGSQPDVFLDQVRADCGGLPDLADLLCRAIFAQPPALISDGGFIADGYHEELDRLRNVGRDGQAWLSEFQRREVERTGIAALKVGFNRVFGYYIEVPNSGRDKVPPEFVRKQTIKNAERYITDELKKYETEVLTAEDRAKELELRLFEALRQAAADKLKEILQVADAVGRLDCVAALAELAVQRRYVQPEIVEERMLEIRDGRHPVLDQSLSDEFVPNDTLMTAKDARVFVITGPNMAGKSTYIRQVALLTLLAQTGSFVPAARMRFSLVDRVFARVGASDEIMRGQSTFMVEMTEAANILHNATERSLVVLDELGRGTSTFDGLSLAWAITEHLTNRTKCFSLVATHYHELTELAELLTGVCNFNVAVREYQASDRHDEGIVFLHRIVEGGASKSYGVHVARLAGIPKNVIARSKEVLDELQRGFERESRTPQLSRNKTKDDAQLPLFHEPGEDILDALREIDPECTTPLDALRILTEWKERFGEGQ